jgi:hypothetical protein
LLASLLDRLRGSAVACAAAATLLTENPKRKHGFQYPSLL